MPWPVRTRLLLAEIRATPGANTPHYSATVPTGKTWLVKDWRLYNAGAGTITTALLVSDGTNVYVLSVQSQASGASNGQVGTSIALPAGYKVGYQSSANTAIHAYISGAQLG